MNSFPISQKLNCFGSKQAGSKNRMGQSERSNLLVLEKLVEKSDACNDADEMVI